MGKLFNKKKEKKWIDLHQSKLSSRTFLKQASNG